MQRRLAFAALAHTLSPMRFHNSTTLDGERLLSLLTRHSAPWPHEGLTVRVRWSRGAPFSGSCYYDSGRIFINLGRNVRYPYRLGTNLAPARSTMTGWRRELLYLAVPDAYRLVLFIHLHELYHYLVRRAGRNPRRREGMCDRFAARALVDDHDCSVTRGNGTLVDRAEWDFQDLDGFVGGATVRCGGRLAP